MVIRRLWLIAFSVFCSLTCSSMLLANDEDIKEQINRIKSDDSYLGAESTHEDWGYAYLQAVEEIQYYLNLQRAEAGLDTLSVPQVKTGVRSLRHMRGNKTRVFAYVKLNDMLQAVPIPDKAPTELNQSPDSLMKESYQLADSVTIEVVPLVQENTIEAPAIAADTVRTEYLAARPKVSSSGLIEVITSLRLVQMIDDAVNVLEQSQKEGKVQDFAKINGLSDIQDNMFLIMYNKQSKKVQALLEVQQGQYRNLKTNQIEGLDTYRGSSAFWFK